MRPIEEIYYEMYYPPRSIFEDLSTREHSFAQAVTIVAKRESYEGTARKIVIEEGEVKIKEDQALTSHIPDELRREWPEVVNIARKLIARKSLSRQDEHWINELAEAVGWSKDDIIDELINMDILPSERAVKYRKLFEEYYAKAQEFKRKGDTKQAAEKLWGAVTALIKLYAANKGVFVAHWSIGKLDNFITNNVEEKYKKAFRDLLDKAKAFHEHFYEGYMDEKTFEERWKEIMKYIKEVVRIALTISS